MEKVKKYILDHQKIELIILLAAVVVWKIFPEYTELAGSAYLLYRAFVIGFGKTNKATLKRLEAKIEALLHIQTPTAVSDNAIPPQSNS